MRGKTISRRSKTNNPGATPGQLPRPMRKTVWIAGAAVAAAAAIGGALLLGPAQTVLATSQDSPRTTAIPALAPADSDTFVIAPYSKQWWAKVASMASPETGLTALDPDAAGLKIENIGYSRSPDHVKREVDHTGPFRVFYIEAPTDEEAKRVAKWLREADGYEGRRIFLQGRIVVVLPSWGDTYEAPKDNITAVPGFNAQVTSGTAAMWRNVDKTVDSLVPDPKSSRGAAVATVLTKGYGFKQGSTWVGTSKTGDDWSGSFHSGGVDPASIDFKETMNTLASSEKVLAKYEYQTTKYEFIDKGVGDLLSNASFVAPGQPGRMGDGQASAASPIDNPAVTARIDVSRFNAAASGIDSGSENVSDETVTANGHDMVVSLRYSK